MRLIVDTPGEVSPPVDPESRRTRRERAAAVAAVVPALLPGALVVLLAFQAGGFFPQSYSIAASGLAVLLALAATALRRPAGGLTPPAAAGLAALTLFAVWMLVSSQWSHAPGRALVEYCRALLYVLVLALCALPAPRETKLSWGLRGTAAGMGVVCGAALISRLAPDLIGDGYPGRLSWPVTYWNGLGCLAAAAIVLTLHLAASPREPRTVRVLGAAALPALAATLYLTLSRGGIAAAAIGLLVYLLCGRPRGLPGALIAAVPACALAVVVAYRSPVLVDASATGAQLAAEGHRVGRIVLAAMGGAAVLRLLTLPLDAWLSRLTFRIPRIAFAALAAAVVAAVVASHAPEHARVQVKKFMNGSGVSERDPRRRLLSVSNNNRTEHWRVAMKGYRASPLHGSGAGTYENEWNRERRLDFHVLDAHSLYIETLGELGIVGLALLLATLGSLAGGIAWRARGPRRPELIAVLAAAAVWAASAGVDWDWELTSVSVWVFGLAGLALAGSAKPSRLRAAVPHPALRVLVALGCLLLALQPALLWRSQVRAVDGVKALAALDCPAAIDAALDSIAAVGSRAEPWELLAYCDSRSGRGDLAIRAARAAVARDPGDWEYHYALALVLAAGGRDPRPEAATALRLNPFDPSAAQAVELLRGKTPRSWRRGVATLPLSAG